MLDTQTSRQFPGGQVRPYGVFPAYQDQFDVGVLRNVLQRGRNDHGRSVVSSHGI